MASDSRSPMFESMDSESTTVAERLVQPDEFSLAHQRHVLNVLFRVGLDEIANDSVSAWLREVVVVFREQRRRWFRNRSRRDVFRHMFCEDL